MTYIDKSVHGGKQLMAAKLRAPGWYRAALFIVLGIAFSFALLCGLRAAFDADPVYDGDGVLQVALLTVAAVVPRRHRLLRLLVATGPRGKPTSSTTTPTTARTRWKDYFKVNTDHKVIGIQYICTSFFFLFVGGLMAMLVRAELAAAGPAVRRREHLQRPLLGPRVAPDLPVRHPGLRRASRTTCCR